MDFLHFQLLGQGQRPEARDQPALHGKITTL